MLMVVFTDDLVKGIVEDNPWWVDGKFLEELPLFCRADFDHFLRELSKPIVNVMVGPRRVGKTTLIKQLIKHLIEVDGVNPRQILFLTLEKLEYELVENKLHGLISYYEQFVLKKSLSLSTEKVYLFVDEAQYDVLWPRVMKNMVDKKYNVHCLVSGSSVVSLNKDRESGAGRFHLRQMVTLKFRDSLFFEANSNFKELKTFSKELRDCFKESCVKKKINSYFDKLKEVELKVSKYREAILHGFETYLLKGGYPEFYGEMADWLELSKFYRDNVFDVVLQKDVINMFSLKFPMKIRTLMVLIAKNSSKILSRRKITETLNIKSALTVDQYVDALTEAFLVRVSSRFVKSGYPSTKEKKFYVADVGIRNCLLGKKDINFSSIVRGGLVESVVLNHCLRLEFFLDGQFRREGNYWMDENEERDVVLDLRDSFGISIPIEVKNGACGGEDILKMKKTISKLSSSFGIIICNDRLGLMGNVLIVPAWMFVLSC